MAWDWLGQKRIALSWTWRFNAPDASKDKCLRCAVERRFHKDQTHEFVEKEK